jgi:hypothetical protein
MKDLAKDLGERSLKLKGGSDCTPADKEQKRLYQRVCIVG